jgi:hypothetical protein
MAAIDERLLNYSITVDNIGYVLRNCSDEAEAYSKYAEYVEYVKHTVGYDEVTLWKGIEPVHNFQASCDEGEEFIDDPELAMKGQGATGYIEKSSYPYTVVDVVRGKNGKIRYLTVRSNITYLAGDRQKYSESELIGRRITISYRGDKIWREVGTKTRHSMPFNVGRRLWHDGKEESK